MRLDRSDFAPLLGIVAGGLFAVVATGSLTLRADAVPSDMTVRVETAVEREVNIQDELVVDCFRVDVPSVELSSRPLIYVDGVRVDEDLRDLVEALDPDAIASIEVVKKPDDPTPGRIEITLER